MDLNLFLRFAYLCIALAGTRSSYWLIHCSHCSMEHDSGYLGPHEPSANADSGQLAQVTQVPGSLQGFLEVSRFPL